MYRADVLCWGECPLCSRNLCKIIFIYNENDDKLSLKVQRWNMAKSNPEWLVEASIKNAFHKYVRHGFGVCIDSFDTFHLLVDDVIPCRKYMAPMDARSYVRAQHAQDLLDKFEWKFRKRIARFGGNFCAEVEFLWKRQPQQGGAETRRKAIP